jgi:hypothetical protein
VIVVRRAWKLMAFALVFVCAGALREPSAHAEAPRCEAIVVIHDEGFTAPWRDAVAALRAQLSLLAPQECVALTLEIRRHPEGARLRASTADGAIAERVVRAPSSLVPFALGLVASIPHEEPPPPATKEPAAPPAVTSSQPPSPAPAPAPPPPPPLTVEAPRLRVSLGAALGARVGEPTGVVMGDAEVRGDLVREGWLVVASVRYAPFGARVIGKGIQAYAYDELALGIGGGRRFEIGATSLDLAIVPTIVLVDEEGDVRDVSGDSASGSHSYLRVDTSLRWLFARAGSWRFGVTLDVDFAPYAIATPPSVEPLLPPIPSWTFGMRLGAVREL